MIWHHIQRDIIHKLLTANSLRFSDLKPDGMDNNAFTYHLQKVVSAGLAEKSSDGQYALTEEGRRLGGRLTDESYSLSVKPHSVLFLIVRRAEDGAWLLYERKTHPLKGRIGFMHAAPSPEASVAEVASSQLKEKTGLAASFTPLGGGFFRTMRGGELESYTQFSLLISEDARGDLVANHESADYFWQVDPDFRQSKMLPNMPKLVQLYQEAKPFFVDQVFQISSAEA